MSSPQGQDAFGEQPFVAAMLRYEAALVAAQARAGLVPQEAAQSIIGTCKVELFDTRKIVRDSVRAGNLAIPMVQALQEIVALFNPAAAVYVHLGSTSQDVLDTAMALIAKDLLCTIESDLQACASALLALATRHADSPALARTQLQPTSVTSLGLQCVNWAAPLVRSLQRIRSTKARALQVQTGGAAGSLVAMQLHGEQVRAWMAVELGLAAPCASWNSPHEEWVALCCELGLMTGSLGKLGKAISRLSQFEVGELVPAPEIENQSHPLASMAVLAAAQRMPQRVAALLAAMPHGHDHAMDAWQAEMAECSQLLVCAQVAVHAMAGVLLGLRVDTARMNHNIAQVVRTHTRSGCAQGVDPALVVQAGVQARRAVHLLQAQLAL